MDTRCRGHGHDVTLIAVIEYPVDVGVRLEVAHVDRVSIDRIGADGNRKHPTSWVIVAA